MLRENTKLKDVGEVFKVPASEIRRRTLRIQNELQQNGIDGLFIVQRVDLFYFSGTAQNGFLYTGNKKLSRGESVMVDMGLVLNGYHLDETRMFAIGAMPDKAMKASQAAIEIHNAVLAKAKPGVTLSELFEYAANVAESKGLANPYLGTIGHKVSFIGHGIGLEIVEPPFIAKNRKQPLEPGMTLALEPKMVYENEFAAGIESVFVVTETGSRLITKIPVEVFLC